MSSDRLLMPIGEVIFTQRSIRKFRPDAIPPEDLYLLLEAAVMAPNGGNHQIIYLDRGGSVASWQ